MACAEQASKQPDSLSTSGMNSTMFWPRVPSTAPLQSFSFSGQEFASVVQSVQSSTSSQVEKRKQVSEKGKLGAVRSEKHKKPRRVISKVKLRKPAGGKIGEKGALGLIPASGAAILDGLDARQRAQSVLVHPAHQILNMASSAWET